MGEGSKVFGVRFPVLFVFDFKSVNIFEHLNEYLERITSLLEAKGRFRVIKLCGLD